MSFTSRTKQRLQIAKTSIFDLIEVNFMPELYEIAVPRAHRVIFGSIPPEVLQEIGELFRWSRNNQIDLNAELLIKRVRVDVSIFARLGIMLIRFPK